MTATRTPPPSPIGTPAAQPQRLPSLFERWLALELADGRPLKDVLAALNAACGTKYRHNWPSVMAGRGYSTDRIPGQVRAYMVRRVLPAVAAEHGLTVDDKLVEALIECLT